MNRNIAEASSFPKEISDSPTLMNNRLGAYGRTKVIVTLSKIGRQAAGETRALRLYHGLYRGCYRLLICGAEVGGSCSGLPSVLSRLGPVAGRLQQLPAGASSDISPQSASAGLELLGSTTSLKRPVWDTGTLSNQTLSASLMSTRHS